MSQTQAATPLAAARDDPRGALDVTAVATGMPLVARSAELGAGLIGPGDRRPQRTAVTALSAAAGGPIRSGASGCRPASRS